MTGKYIHLIIEAMGKPGRRPSTSVEWKLAFIQRVIDARTKTGLTPSQFAAQLEKLSGRELSYDTYRKYELLHPKDGSLLRHDLIYAFCELTKTHPNALLEGPSPFPQVRAKTVQNRRHVA